MKRLRLGLALCMTVLLIGGSLWVRFARTPKPSGSLAVVDNEQNDQDIPSEADYLAAAAELSTPKADAGDAANLSTTDLISRQFVTDYLALEAKGQATDENVTALADTYAGNIAEMHPLAIAKLSDLTVVSDTQASLQNYSDDVTTIYNKYHDLAGNLLSKAPDLRDPNTPEFASTMASLATLYERASAELLTSAVPQSLSNNHLKLINTYIGNIQNLRALANIDQDAASAYGALAIASNAGAEEDAILLDIRGALLSKGILFSAGT